MRTLARKMCARACTHVIQIVCSVTCNEDCMRCQEDHKPKIQDSLFPSCAFINFSKISFSDISVFFFFLSKPQNVHVQMLDVCEFEHVDARAAHPGTKL